MWARAQEMVLARLSLGRGAYENCYNPQSAVELWSYAGGRNGDGNDYRLRAWFALPPMLQSRVAALPVATGNEKANWEP